jgi:hypothetical protein
MTERKEIVIDEAWREALAVLDEAAALPLYGRPFTPESWDIMQRLSLRLSRAIALTPRPVRE